MSKLFRIIYVYVVGVSFLLSKKMYFDYILNTCSVLKIQNKAKTLKKYIQ